MDTKDYIRMWREADLARYVARSEYLDEVMRLLLEKHGISFVYMGDWCVCDREKGRLQSFPTFSKAFEFAMGLLERTGEVISGARPDENGGWQVWDQDGNELATGLKGKRMVVEDIVKHAKAKKAGNKPAGKQPGKTANKTPGRPHKGEAGRRVAVHFDARNKLWKVRLSGKYVGSFRAGEQERAEHMRGLLEKADSMADCEAIIADYREARGNRRGSRGSRKKTASSSKSPAKNCSEPEPASDKPGSELEQLFEAYWHMLSPGSVAPEREARLIPGRRFRSDFVWRTEKVVVEVDGGQYQAHGGRHNTDTDREKLNELAIHGFRVLRFSGSMLKSDPAGCIETVRRCLGWKGQI